MTDEKVIELAKHAVCYDRHDKLFWASAGQIQEFAQLVRNETLEWAAGLCDDDCQEQIRSLKS